MSLEENCFKIGQHVKTIKLSLVNSSALDRVLKIDNPEKPINLDLLYPYIRKNRTPNPFTNIIKSSRKHHSSFGVIETPYIDLDFIHGHTEFYDLGFAIHPIYCQRLHFFSGGEKYFDLLKESLINGEDENFIKEKAGFTYVGFCVLRPTPSFVVGRSAVAFDETPINQLDKNITPLDEEKNGKPYLNTYETVRVNILNSQFEVQAPPFIQQDPNLGRCGTASLWMATHLMASQYETKRFFYATITKQAVGGGDKLHDTTTIYDPTDPNDGLGLWDIRKAFSETGAHSFNTYPKPYEGSIASYNSITQELYSLVESGFPSILCIKPLLPEPGTGHVVVSVGHLLPQIKSIKKILHATPFDTNLKAQKGKHYLVGNAINLYYVNDDSYGPYRKIRLISPKSKEYKRLSKLDGFEKQNVLFKAGHSEKVYMLDSICSPIPSIVRTKSTNQLPTLLQYFECKYTTLLKSGEVALWRSILVESSVFKKSLKSRNYSKDLVNWYAHLHFPKYVWVYELSIFEPQDTIEYFNYDNNRKICGEFIFDATTSSHDVRLISERALGLYNDYRFEETHILEDNKFQLYECIDLNRIKGGMA